MVRPRSKSKKKHKLVLGTDGIIPDVGTKADLWNSWVGFNFSIERKWYSNSVKETHDGSKGVKVQGRWRRKHSDASHQLMLQDLKTRNEWFGYLSTIMIRTRDAKRLACRYRFYFQKRGVKVDFCTTKIMGFIAILGTFFNWLLDRHLVNTHLEKKQSLETTWVHLECVMLSLCNFFTVWVE